MQKRNKYIIADGDEMAEAYEWILRTLCLEDGLETNMVPHVDIIDYDQPHDGKYQMPTGIFYDRQSGIALLVSITAEEAYCMILDNFAQLRAKNEIYTKRMLNSALEIYRLHAVPGWRNIKRE